MIVHGETPELKQQNKSVLYVLFNNAPSATVRAYVFRPEFLKRGIKVDYFLMTNIIFDKIIDQTKNRVFNIFFRIIRKCQYIYKCHQLLKRVRYYNTIVIIKYIKSRLLQLIRENTNARIIFDLDDAIWLNNFLGIEEFRKIILLSDIITADNSYLSECAARYNKESFVVHGPSQIELFIKHEDKKLQESKTNDEIVLGWVGSFSTLFYLYKIYEALEELAKKYPNIILKLVGTGNKKESIPPFEKIKLMTIPWYDQVEMIRQVKTFDIGLYPLFNNELSLGRGSLKATIYMSAQVPVVCSGIGENKKIIEDGVNGLLANTTEEWIEKLSRLIENEDYRDSVGLRGFEYAKKYYSLEYCFTQFYRHLKLS